MSADLVPTIDDLRPVVLRVLSDGQERQVQEVCDLVAEHLELSAEARSQRIPSGQKRYVNRTNWACSGLTQAGLLERPKRGWYQITEDGRDVDVRGLSSYSEKDMLEWPTWQAYQQEIADRKKDTASPSPTLVAEAADPIETLEAWAASYNASVETMLRRKLQESSPEFFEKAVLDLLWAMGFGGPHGDKKHVGRSGDGGIDGVINQDALGLRRLCVQAKRYRDGNNVGAGEIRDFYGALRQRHAERGVFITTAKFTSGAIEAAASFNGEIILIDGVRLTELMLSKQIGVEAAATVTLYRVDEDFFEPELT